MKSNKKTFNMVMNNYGDLNKDKILYFYHAKKSGTGFGGQYILSLEHMYWADFFKFTFVESYSEEKLNNASVSIFEYYEPINSISADEVMKSQCVIDATEEHRNVLRESFGIFGPFLPKPEYMDLLADIHNKYLHLKKDVKIKIENDIKNLFGGKKTIGVHVRGSDFKIGFKEHPVAVDPSSDGGHISILKDNMNKYGFEQIFLATEEVDTIKLFKDKFGEKVIYFNDVFRVTGTISPGLVKCDRENHDYLLGLEVLRDMYALASCDGLIAGLSNVSTLSIILKKTFGEKFEFLNIINNGCYGEEGKDAERYVYKWNGIENEYSVDKRTPHQKYYELLLKWIYSKNFNKNFADYFIKMSYQKIAIYGFGTLGKLFFDEIKESNIEVNSFIDKNAEKFIDNEYNITVIEPNKINDLKDVDCIVISPIGSYKEIHNMLKNQARDKKIISLEDVVNLL